MIGRGRNLSENRNEITLQVRGSREIRLDQYLKANLVWRSRTRIQRLIRSGYVTVNDGPVKPSLAVRSGDVVTVRLSDGTGMPDYSALDLEVLYEDRWLVGLNKPAGLLVHPVGRHVYDTLINYLHFRYRDQMTACGETLLRLCHRIDRDTTGVLLVAKDRYVNQSVSSDFQNRRVSKEYVALVQGSLGSTGSTDTPEFTIDRPLADGRRLETALTGPVLRPSQTRIRVLERFATAAGEYSFVLAKPITGRQNQIRVHLASVAHPLVGDVRYGGPEPPAGFPDRFLLHASRLRFYHPRLKSPAELEAPLPQDFAELLERLRGKSCE